MISVYCSIHTLNLSTNRINSNLLRRALRQRGKTQPADHGIVTSFGKLGEKERRSGLA